MERESFVFYRSFFEGLSCLNDDDQLACYKAIANYALYGEEPDIDGAAKGIFLTVKPQIDANNKRYADGCKGAEHGIKGGRPKKNPTGDIDKNPIGVMSETPNENENVNVNENVNEIKEKESKKKSADKPHRSFVPPTVEEVRDYCKGRNNNIDPQSFIDFYTSKGWMVGKNKMKDWKASVRTWEQRSRGQPTNSKIEIDSNFRESLRKSEVIDFGM